MSFCTGLYHLPHFLDLPFIILPFSLRHNLHNPLICVSHSSIPGTWLLIMWCYLSRGILNYQMRAHWYPSPIIFPTILLCGSCGSDVFNIHGQVFWNALIFPHFWHIWTMRLISWVSWKNQIHLISAEGIIFPIPVPYRHFPCNWRCLECMVW